MLRPFIARSTRNERVMCYYIKSEDKKMLNNTDVEKSKEWSSQGMQIISKIDLFTCEEELNLTQVFVQVWSIAQGRFFAGLTVHGQVPFEEERA